MGDGQGSLGPVLLLAALGLLVFSLARGRRQQRQLQTVQSRLTPGTEVMTGSGLFGTVVAVEDSVVVLETAPGQTSRWDRRAVVRVVTPPAVQPDGRDADDAADDEQGPPGRE